MKLIKTSAVASAIGIALIGAGTGAVNAAGSMFGVDAAPAEQDAVAESAVGRYIVTFAEPGLVQYKGGTPGLSRTAPQLDGVSLNSSKKFVMQSAAAQEYKSYLAQKRAEHLVSVQQAIGRQLDIHFTYDVIRNGVSASMSVEEAARVASLPGVVSVTPVQEMEAQTFRGPKFIGADKIWDGTALPIWAQPTRGEGVKVGVIDTGTYIGHPSFTNDPACGFSAAEPKLFPRDCTVNNGTTCTGTQPDADRSSHGVHTSSTAAGNTIDNTVTPAPLLPNGMTMSGVAPCASIYSYNVANHSDGSLASDALDAALQNAIVDQVDVVNYSIGYTCGGGNPWADLEFLDVADADIFISASAGNTRETCTNPVGLVGNNGPWVLTVANSSQDKLGAPTLTVTGPGTVANDLKQIGVSPGSTTLIPANTVDRIGADIKTVPANIEGCTASGGIAAGTFTATDIAVVRRGTCPFSEKITNAYNAGARTVIVANNQAGGISMDTTGAPTDVAAFSISSQAIGDALIAFANANAAKGDYQRFEITSRQGDVISGGSLRGPTKNQYKDLTKPDITGPGTDIYAAYMASDGNYGLMSGTSMSAPHLAGAAALIRATHPDWTPYEVKSAIQTTAVQVGYMENGTTPWNADVVGSGRVDLTKAALAGLTLNETKARFLAANPSGGTINQKELNLASMRNVACGSSCTWTRTVKNRLRGDSDTIFMDGFELVAPRGVASGNTWTVAVNNPTGYTLTVSPSTFTLAEGDEQVLTITATAVAAPTESISFGTVNLTETSAASPDQHLTVAIQGQEPGTQPPGAYCNDGVCVLQIDTMPESGGSFSGLGCASYCGMIWLNQFSPAASEYPITLKTIQAIFGSGAGWNAAGDKINIYVYLDGDDDPTNGATLVGSYNYTMPAPANAWRTITLPTPIVVNGPGKILIAMTNPSGNTGGRPAAADPGPFNGHGWLGDYTDTPAGSAPNLATLGLEPNNVAVPGFDRNWLLRATGTNGAGRPLTLDPSAR